MPSTRKILIATLLLIGPRLAFADATSELWTALKAANDKDALAAIAKGADLKKPDAGGTPPLHLAACFSGPEVIKAMIDAKADVNALQAANGHTPLMNAANWSNTEVVKLLLAAGANVKVKSKLGLPTLAVALAGCKLEIVKLIVDAGADPKESYRVAPFPYDINLLNAMIGVYSPAEKVKNLAGNYPMIHKNLGLTYPARLLEAKESDFTPLDEFTKYILEKGGFDPNQKVEGTWGCILNMAVEHGKVGMVKALLDAKATTETNMWLAGQSAKTGLRTTPLLVAAVQGNNAIVELLLKAGAKVNVLVHETESSTSTSGNVRTTYTIHYANTAVSLASANGHPDTAALLRKYGGLGPTELK